MVGELRVFKVILKSGEMADEEKNKLGEEEAEEEGYEVVEEQNSEEAKQG